MGTDSTWEKSAQLDSRNSITHCTAAAFSSKEQGSNTQHTNRTNTTSAPSSPTKHHPRTARPTHPPTDQAIHPPTNPPIICYSRTAANRCVGSYLNFAIVGRYSEDNKYCTKENNHPALHRHESTHPRTKRPPPTHQPTNPPTYQIPQPPCATGVQQHLQQQTEAFRPYSISYLEHILKFGTLNLQRSKKTFWPPILTHPPTHHPPTNRQRPLLLHTEDARTYDYNTHEKQTPLIVAWSIKVAYRSRI